MLKKDTKLNTLLAIEENSLTSVRQLARNNCLKLTKYILKKFTRHKRYVKMVQTKRQELHTQTPEKINV